MPDPSPRPALVITVFASCGLAVSLMQTLVVPLLPQFPRLLSASTATVAWLVTATLVAGAVCAPMLGRLGDMYGRRRMLLVALALVTAGSALGAVAPDVGVLIVARVLQGASLGVVPLGISIMRDVLPPGKVGSGIALMSSSLGIGGAIGLPITGLVAQQASWRWLFAGAAVLGVVLFVAVRHLVHESPLRSGGRLDPHRIRHVRGLPGDHADPAGTGRGRVRVRALAGHGRGGAAADRRGHDGVLAGLRRGVGPARAAHHARARHRRARRGQRLVGAAARVDPADHGGLHRDSGRGGAGLLRTAAADHGRGAGDGVGRGQQPQHAHADARDVVVQRGRRGRRHRPDHDRGRPGAAVGRGVHGGLRSRGLRRTGGMPDRRVHAWGPWPGRCARSPGSRPARCDQGAAAPVG